MQLSRRVSKRLLGAAVLAIAGIGAMTTASLALFTDTETVASNAFSTGTVDLTTSPASAAVTFSNMSPGDQVTSALTVTNAGTLALRYALTSTTTEDTLAAQLDMTVKVGVSACTDLGFGADGTIIYATGDLGSTGGLAVFGDPTAGAHAGDRSLASLANEELCFNVTLPASTANSFQGTSTTASLAFSAEQTANNP